MGTRSGAACVIICLLVSGCAAETERISIRAAHTDSAPTVDLRVDEKTRSAYAAFKKGEHQGYEVSIAASYEIPQNHTWVEVHGEFEVAGQELYYAASNVTRDATAVDQTINLTINSTLTSATLTASVHINRCTDEDDLPVTDSRCPVGQRIDVAAQWNTTKPVEYMGTQRADGNHPGHGRLSTATGRIGSTSYTAEYALIMEYFLVQ